MVTRRIVRAMILVLGIFASWTAIAPQSKAQTIPESVQDTVAFLVLPAAADETRPSTPIGTGFFVGMSYGDVKDRTWIFLVTARHVVLAENGMPRPKLRLRVNAKDSHRAQDLYELLADRWFFHEKPNAVDLAVYPLLPKEAEFKYISNADFVTQDTISKNRIGIGDDVFYLGLLSFEGAAAADRVSPVARFGRLALTSDQPMLSDGRFFHFVDANNMPGHSGSPVFLWATPSRSAWQVVAAPRIFGLYGIVSGVVEYSKDLKARLPQQSVGSPVAIDYRNAGLTAVVPVKFLVEILNREEIRKAVGAAH